MSGVVPFTGQRGTIYYPSREEIEVKGKARERWVVIILKPDGEENYHPVKTKNDALWLANILREVEVKKRQDQHFLESNPVWQTLMQVPPQTRDLMLKLLETDQRMRE